MTPKKIAAFALGPIGAAAVGFFTLPLITWFFSQEDVGRVAMLNVAISFSTLFFSLGLDQAYVREFHETKDKPQLLKETATPGLVCLLLSLLLLLTLDNHISLYLFGLDSFALSALVAIAVVANFVSRFLSLILRMNERGLAYSASQILPKLLLVVVILGYVAFDATKDIVNLLWATVVSASFVCGVYAWNTRREWLLAIRAKFDFNQLKSLLRYSLPLIFGGLAFWGLTATDKILLKAFSTFEQLGVYSVAVSFAAAATILQSVFSTVWAPAVYKWVAAGEGVEKIHKVSRYVLLAVVALFCLAGLFSWLVTLVLPDSYAEVQWIVIPCLGYPLLYTLSETTVVGIGITRRSGFAMLAATIAFIFNAVAGWLLIPLYGAAGAAISTCLAFVIFLILRTEFSIHLWQPIPRRLLYSYTILVVTGAVVSCIYGNNFRFGLMLFWGAVLGSVLIFFMDEVDSLKSGLCEFFRGKNS